MSSSRGKKVAVPASKKRKGASSSSGPTAEVRHPSLSYIELLSSSSYRNYKLHRERFSTTAMSYSTTTIATTRYNILLAQDLWTNEPLPPLEYPPPPRIDYSPKLQFEEFIIQEVSHLPLSYDYKFILSYLSLYIEGNVHLVCMEGIHFIIRKISE
ncbi:hypothetical protein GOBAR_AA07347 [Gossypium barbadense]|uniref:Uncharacterized protein n=1 Tax=Gossypium barbadense TaxID=3634 RepID=A0A2P5YCG6_GOSBA|nr:hypothetical protein GOBAR_AA07347 [Gossypium barbadense]